MKYLLGFLVALSACNLHEGERVNVAGVQFEGMAWSVSCDRNEGAELKRLDKRHADEYRSLEYSYSCLVGDPAPGGGYVAAATDCAEYHQIWRHYWQARRELAECSR